MMKHIIFAALIILPSLSIKTQSFDHTSWDTFLNTHVDSEGLVNYKGIKNSPEQLNTYLDLLSKKQPNSSTSKNEKLAYWINAYNAFTIKLIIDNYPLKSIKDIGSPWDKKFILLTNKLVSLNYIEHEILRKMDEPRIHFGIVCASVSCPNLLNEAFIASKLESQLTTATKAFLADPSKNTLSKNTIKISNIFKWFAKDFKQNGPLIDFLNTYSNIQISPKAKKSYKDYNWDLNE